MTRFTFYTNPTLTVACLPAETPATFSIDAAAIITGVHPEKLRYYCQCGLLGEERDGADEDPTFDEESLDEVRRIEDYRRRLAVSRRALPLVCGLRREAERQGIEIHFLSGP
jgi:DNA-binding transcriptional MerR regulator